MLEEGRLELLRGNVLSTTAQVVGLPVNEVQPPVFVEASQVSSVVPEIPETRDGFGRLAPVALEHHIGLAWPRRDLANGSRRENPIFVVQDSQFIEVGFAAGCPDRHAFPEHGRGNKACLSLAVSGATRRPYSEAIPPNVDEFRREGNRPDSV